MLDLATLVSPLSVSAFLDGHWPATPWSAPSGPERVAALAGVEVLASSEAALAGAGQVLVFKPDGSAGRVPTGEQAIPLFRLGLTCSFGGLHIPELRAAAASVASGLGVPPAWMACEVFCSSGSSGARMHSDHDVNFALLLRGRKRWRLAPNEHIRNQTNMCLPGGLPPPDPLQLRLADRLPFPSTMPSDALLVDVADGGLVFLPRGWWHETASEGECLQVNFVVRGPTWIGVLFAALERRLTADPEWRAMAFDALLSDRRPAGESTLSSLLAGLAADLSSTSAADLLRDADL